MVVDNDKHHVPNATTRTAAPRQPHNSAPESTGSPGGGRPTELVQLLGVSLLHGGVKLMPQPLKKADDHRPESRRDRGPEPSQDTLEGHGVFDE